MDGIDTDDEDSAGVSLWEQEEKNLSICSCIAAARFSTAPFSLHIFCAIFSIINQEALSIQKVAGACVVRKLCCCCSFFFFSHN